MIIRKIKRDRPSRIVIDEAIGIMRDGGVVIYPTDTIYGLGVNALDDRAVKRLFRIKGRDPDKPVSICLADVREIPEFSRPSPRAMEIIKRILPGPYTVVLEKNDRIPDILTAGSMKVGLRVPDEKVCTLLSAEFPVTSTSANISGKPQGASLDEIIRDIPDADMAIDGGAPASMEPSTVIDLTVHPPRIVRMGRGGTEFLKDIMD